MAKKHVVIEPGTVFGYLTVVNHLGSNKHGQAMYDCRCTCGKWGMIVAGYKLRRGESKSCGCKRAALRALTMETVAGADGKSTAKVSTLDNNALHTMDATGDANR